ncbi:MAG: radical SAM protein [Anaerolineales bacterium]|nr:radical SAM protein [Anaerolineales bacterium]MCX7755875.1 radical SAM protein [Anaerolineales bacterium]MDW8277961.1 radical SAM protein [Anaerolineales bacterium]
MNLFERIKTFFTPVQPLPAAMYHYQSPPEDKQPYRLHLRLHQDGSGLLIVNASTVLHLNPTAAEFALHFIRGDSPVQTAREIASRYRIRREQAQKDYLDFIERIETLIRKEDLDPISYLDFERVPPNSTQLTAPLRLDCALTYRLPPGADPFDAPQKRVERELTTAEWLSILDKVWAYGVPHIVFTGGEPTLREDLPDLIARAEKNGQVCGLLTDGHKLAQKEYLDTLLQTGLDHLMIVLPSRSEPNWQALQNALVADIFLAVHLTITPKNVQTAPALMQKLHAAGIEAMSLSISEQSLHEELAVLRDLAGEMGLRLVFDLPVPYSAANPVALEVAGDAVPSGAGKAWLYVEPDGDVLPAQGMAHIVLGNILTDAWEKLYS